MDRSAQFVPRAVTIRTGFRTMQSAAESSAYNLFIVLVGATGIEPVTPCRMKAVLYR